MAFRTAETSWPHTFGFQTVAWPSGTGGNLRRSMPTIWSEKRVLVAVNEARPTGAPRCAIEDLNQLRSAGCGRAALLLEGGPLESRFRSLSDSGVTVPARGIASDLCRRARWRGSKIGANREFRHIEAILDEARPDAVIAHTLVAAGVASVAVARSIPTLLVVHDSPQVMRTFARAYALSDWSRDVTFIANSFATVSELRSVVAVDRVNVLYPPVRMPNIAARTLRPPDAPLRLLGVGRIGRSKGLDLWLDVVRKLVDAQHDIEATWIGGGDLRWGARQVRLRRLAGHVRFMPPKRDLAEALLDADVLAVSSRWESFGLVGVEALASGLPVVAFDVGGVREALGDLATFAPLGDVATMVQEILEAKETDRSRLYEDGRAWAERFSPSAYGSRLLPILASELRCDR